MKTLNRFALALTLAFAAVAANAQTNTLSATTLTAAMDGRQAYAVVASATGIAVGKALFIDNEYMTVKTSYVSGLTVPVSRVNGPAFHISGSMVLAGSPAWFYTKDPQGACTAATYGFYVYFTTPWVNTATGNQWLCSSVTKNWVPGFGNTSTVFQVTAAVASAVGLITPSGPLFHVTGTSGFTGFNIPVGFDYGSFTIIPDGILTTTVANNIALATTTIVGKALTYTYDSVTGKFYPSY